MPSEELRGCIDPELKDELIDIIDDHCEAVPDSDLCGSFLKRLKKLPDCSDYKEKKKRKLSDYQKHMSVCLKDNGNFGSCVQAWRDGKKRNREYEEGE